MSKSLPLMLRHAMYNLRGGFLIRPLTIALALGFAGGFLSWLEEQFPAASAWVPTFLFPSHADPQVAQVILAGIQSCRYPQDEPRARFECYGRTLSLLRGTVCEIRQGASTVAPGRVLH